MVDIDELERELRALRDIPTPRQQATALEQVMARLFAETAEFRETLTPQVTVTSAPATMVPIPASEVRVDVPDQTEALAALTAAVTELIAVLREKETTVTVNLPDLPIEVNLPEEAAGPMRITFERFPNGSIKAATIT